MDFLVSVLTQLHTIQKGQVNLNQNYSNYNYFSLNCHYLLHSKYSFPKIQLFSVVSSKWPENFAQVKFPPKINIQMHFHSYFLYLFD